MNMNWNIEQNSLNHRGKADVWFRAVSKTAGITYLIEAGGAQICDTVEVYRETQSDENLIAARIICADEDPMDWIQQVMNLPPDEFEELAAGLVDS